MVIIMLCIDKVVVLSKSPGTVLAHGRCDVSWCGGDDYLGPFGLRKQNAIGGL